MKYDFWRNVKIGDELYYYDTNNLVIGHFLIKAIKDKSMYTGSFIIETDCDKYHHIYVHAANYLNDGYVGTWNHTTSEQLFININKHELIDHLKDELYKKISKLKNQIDHYQNLLDKIL